MRGKFLNFCSLSKYVGEEYCRLFDRAFGLAIVTLGHFQFLRPASTADGRLSEGLSGLKDRVRRGLE
jgi:hypothetical protein